MSQAEFPGFASAPVGAAQRRALEAWLAISRQMTDQWAKLADLQLSFVRDSLEVALSELTRARESEPRTVFDWQMATTRRVLELTLRHLQRTGELALEGQRELFAQIAQLAATAAMSAGEAGGEAARAATAAGAADVAREAAAQADVPGGGTRAYEKAPAARPASDAA